MCTLGDKWNQDLELYTNMLNNGMNVARLDFSDQMIDHSTHKDCVENLRNAIKEQKKHCAIVLDTKGPEILTGNLQNQKPVDIIQGQSLNIVTDQADIGDKDKIICNYPHLASAVNVGSTIFIQDGELVTEVVEIGDNSVRVICKNSCRLGEQKKMNLPGAQIELPPLTA